MPTYEYRCSDCEHQFEAFQAMSAEPLTECPVCGGRINRLIGGGAGLVFKGSGFYITDYKNQKSDNKSDKPKDSTPATEKSPKKNND